MYRINQYLATWTIYSFLCYSDFTYEITAYVAGCPGRKKAICFSMTENWQIYPRSKRHTVCLRVRTEGSASSSECHYAEEEKADS